VIAIDDVGAVNAIEIFPSLGVATREVGAVGTATGVITDDAAENEPVPVAFMAATWNS
jgi:hypothetical protein